MHTQSVKVKSKWQFFFNMKTGQLHINSGKWGLGGGCTGEDRLLQQKHFHSDTTSPPRGVRDGLELMCVPIYHLAQLL